MNNEFYYEEESDPNDAPGLKGLVLGCLLASCLFVFVVGAILVLSFFR